MCGLSIYFLFQRGLIYLHKNKIKSSNIKFSKFISNWINNEHKNIVPLFAQFDDFIFTYEADFLGATYESLRTVSDKSRLGAFFTPTHIICDIQIPTDQTVLDPCSGTGTILLNILNKDHIPKNITLRDIDPLALNIARVNFALFFNRVDALVNIEVKNIYSKYQSKKFDYVVTNPPFGAKLSQEERVIIRHAYPRLKTTESFSITLHNCIKNIQPKGKLHIILPESILYVDAHFNIRSMLFKIPKSIKIKYLNHAFKGIMSKIIRVDIDFDSTDGDIQFCHRNFQWKIPLNILSLNQFRPPFISTQEDIDIITKVLDTNIFYLKKKCKFGLGIVTGNNDFHLKNYFGNGLEPIYTGKELTPFNFKEPVYSIDFIPERLHQVASIPLYRQPKICYRFISNTIVTAIDFEGTLVLNSINFIIPSKDIPIKALSAFLNAPIITFIYQKFYRSNKVLKSHLGSFPIPCTFFEHIEPLTQLYDEGASGKNINDKLNQLTCSLYGLTKEESEYVLKNMPKMPKKISE
jgi:16S rRNA G966 N2-methylase RsmD